MFTNHLMPNVLQINFIFKCLEFLQLWKRDSVYCNLFRKNYILKGYVCIWFTGKKSLFVIYILQLLLGFKFIFQHFLVFHSVDILGQVINRSRVTCESTVFINVLHLTKNFSVMKLYFSNEDFEEIKEVKI